MRQQDTNLFLPLDIVVQNGTESRQDLGLGESDFHHLKKPVAKSLVVPLEETIECETANGIVDQNGEAPSQPSLKLHIIWLLGQALEAGSDCVNDPILIAARCASPACDQ